MALEVSRPIEFIPKRKFKSLFEIFNVLSESPEFFDYHLHVPIKKSSKKDAEQLREDLLKSNASDLLVSQIWKPQGPHIKYPYYSAYFSGEDLPVVKLIVEECRGKASAVMHPVTGHQYLEHTALATWFGKSVDDSIDYDFLKRCDEEKRTEYPGMGDKQKKMFMYLAKQMAMLCVRDTNLENLHSGVTPSSAAGDYSDVKVVSPYGEIAWNDLSRLSDDEMKVLMKEVVNKVYTFLLRMDDEDFRAYMSMQPISKWDEPELDISFLTDLSTFIDSAAPKPRP